MRNQFLVAICLAAVVCKQGLANPVVQRAATDVVVKPATQEAITDGPYVLFDKQQNHFLQHIVCNGKPAKKISVANHKHQLPLQLVPCKPLLTDVQILDNQRELVEFSGEFPVIAASDFHGQFDLLVQLLTNNDVIDENRHWKFGNGHFVITGDVFDRGDKVTEILWFLYQLEHQAEMSGGKVHLLLGNHEVMVLNADLRYLHKKYPLVANILNKPFEQLYGAETLLGKWLRSKNVLVKINHSLFAHGGFHPDLVAKGYSLRQLNTLFTDTLVKAELEEERTEAANYLHKRNGPVWYRGYFKPSGATAKDIDNLLSHFDVERIVVGHTSQKQIGSRFNGKVIAIDASMKYGTNGELVKITNGKVRRLDLNGMEHRVQEINLVE